MLVFRLMMVKNLRSINKLKSSVVFKNVNYSFIIYLLMILISIMQEII